MNAAEALQQVIAETTQSNVNREPAGLYEPINYLMGLGGKRLRPALVLLAHALHADDQRPCIQPAMAVETFHNFSLMHDDLMDKAPLRRGKPTVHTRWNAQTAILSGDAMLVMAYQQIASVQPAILGRVLSRFSTTALEVCEGQQLDMDFETRNQVTEAEYLEMIRLKTAVLLGFSLELGALAGGATENDAANLHAIGTALGIGFQLMDDILDVYGDPEKFGKQTGGDIVSNKKTFLLIKALETANPAQAGELQNLLSTEDYNPEEKVAAVTAIYNQLNIRAVAEAKMQEYYNRALNGLAGIPGRPAAKAELEKYCLALIGRDM